MLIEQLKKADIEAMKNKDKEARSVLSVVLTKYKLLEVESTANGKELSDSDVLVIIQKCLKELSDEKAGYLKVNNLERVASIENQEKVLSVYLPKQLSKEEILEEINKLEDKSMPTIMKHFKTNFSGKVDMSLVSQIARSL
jgi:uncharacterized protein YqeY